MSCKKWWDKLDQKDAAWAKGDAGDFLQDLGADPDGKFRAHVAAMHEREGETDKAALFPPGPWQTDDDAFEDVDPSTGLMYSVRRVMGPFMGHLCGYVESPHHNGFLSESLYDWCEVHGGVTYCDVWPVGFAEKVFVGFDCAHSFDVIPGMPTATRLPYAAYRDMAFVKAECLKLAAQLAVEPESRKAAFQFSGESEADDES